MIKKHLLSLCFYGCVLFSQAQEMEMFHRILDECILFCYDSCPSYQTKITYNHVIKYKETTYLLMDYYPRFYKAEALKDNDIKYVRFQFPYRKKDFNRKEKRVLVFDGIGLKHDTLVIKFSFRYMYRTRAILHVEMSDGVTFYYVYSPIQQEWLCVRKEEWGI
jgi:hypothetical protein